MTATVTILGAGPAGLGAAFRAAQAGHQVTILERDGRVGGLAGSFEVGGVTVDHGSHRLHPATEPALLAELKGLLGEELQQRTRHGRIYLEGRWIAFPLETADLIRNLPPGFALAAGRDTILAPLRRARGDTFADLLLAGLGPTMCDRFYFPYARKMWGLAPEMIDGEQARRRVRGNAAGKLLRKLTGSGKAGGVFYYPRRGFGQVWDALAGAASRSGADLRLNTPVDRVEMCPGGLMVSAGAERFESEFVWSTLPLPVLARLFRPSPDQRVLDAARRLRLRAMVLVYLVLGVGRYTEFDAHYVPQGFTPVTRISEPKNYRDGDDPGDRTVLCAEIPCAAGDGIWTSGDEDLGRLVGEALAGMGLPTVDPVEVVVKRVPAAYPVYDLDYSDHLGVLVEWSESIPGLLTFGRQGLFAHNNSHHALEMGWAAAAALGSESGFDAEAWAASAESFAAHVVED